MTFVFAVAEAYRRVLVPFLIGAAAVLALMLAVVVVQRLVRAAAVARRRRLADVCEPVVEAAIQRRETDPMPPLGLLRRHRRVAGARLLAAVRALRGSSVDRARELAEAVGLLAQWRRDVSDRRWWRRAEAARALGTVRDGEAFDALIGALEDPHEDVRSAAAGALGRLGDVRAASALLALLSQQSRHQRVLVVGALRDLGPDGGPEIVSYARAHPDRLPLVADLLAHVSGHAGIDDLLIWSMDARPEVRAAALGAMGTIGLDERTSARAIAALDDDEVTVRAMAARAVGRSGTDEGVVALSRRLDDDWTVAAHAARGLAGSARGRAFLRARSQGDGQGSALARQMLWDIEHAHAGDSDAPESWGERGAASSAQRLDAPVERVVA